MTDPGFEILRHEHGLPVRPRSLFVESAVFHGEDTATVLVEPAVHHKLRAVAGHARPREVGGLLAGRCFRDDIGPYVVVLECIQAPLNDGTFGRIHLTAERITELRKHADHAFPSMDVIGWWHSHPSPSEFSLVDRNTQKLWSHPLHVAILVFSEGQPWGTVYLGPSSIPLSASAAVSSGETERDARSVTQRPSERPKPHRRARFTLRTLLSRLLPAHQGSMATQNTRTTKTVRRDAHTTATVAPARSEKTRTESDVESRRRDDALLTVVVVLALVLGVAVLVLSLVVVAEAR